MISDIQQRLVTAFAPITDRALFRAVTEGALLADEHSSVSRFMSTPIGRDLRGHVRRAGVMYSIKEYCDRGDLPFWAEYRPMPKGAWHWLEIRSESVLAHYCRTEHALAFPDETPNRQDARLSNQIDLFEQNVVVLRSELYAWLTAGANKDGALTHLCWGAPAANNDEWLGYRNVLASIASAPIEPPTPTPVSPKDKLRFRDHIQESLEKSNNEKNDESEA